MKEDKKRKHKRIDSLNLLNYNCLDQNNETVLQGMGRTLNVSQGGILLETHVGIQSDYTMSITIGLKNEMIDIKGRVVYSREGKNRKYESGIEFFEITEDSLRILNKYITAFREHKKKLISESKNNSPAIVQTEFSGLKLLKRGKVRDIYDMEDSLLMVATDRISAFDVVMPDPIPGKGKVLNLISMFWFEVMASLVDNHIITGNVDVYPEACRPYAEILRNRSVLVKKADPLPVECIVRGYVSGSGWESYKESQSICGIKLPSGLIESDKLPEPIFTPSTKAELGSHDINIDFDKAVELVGKKTAEQVRDISLMIYKKGSELADERGIIIADTKFEFGIANGEIILIDEVMTPDSSRFWPKDAYAPGGAQKSFDKQYLRDYLLSLDWNKKPPGPPLPDEVIINTKKKYTEALKLLTGKDYEI